MKETMAYTVHEGSYDIYMNVTTPKYLLCSKQHAGDLKHW